ncbi:MAG: hypothetical protein E4H32_10965, partial [Nitrospirales bacterium]
MLKETRGQLQLAFSGGKLPPPFRGLNQYHVLWAWLFINYNSLWQWSVTEIEDFWQSLWEFFEIKASKPFTRVLPERKMPGAEWF